MTVLAVMLATLAAHAGPSYRWCGHHRCGPAHRLFVVRCDGTQWLSPQPVRVPARFRKHGDWWCDEHIPPF